jgi:segregation and condensation protein A
MSDDSSFHVTLGDFSGPLDLLCHLVESREMDASSVKLTDVLSQYVSFLMRSRRATLAELAEFFSMASRLLLRKVRSLLPGLEGDEPDNGGDDAVDVEMAEEGGMDEETLRALLERFKPYRSAAFHLASLKERRERCFVRIPDEGGPPWYDIGDLHGLAAQWWSLIEERSRGRSAGTESSFMAEIPDAVPEEILVESRMDEVGSLLAEFGRTNLSELLRRFGAGGMIVTLLALLELSRLGRIKLAQSELWGDVEVGISG